MDYRTLYSITQLNLMFHYPDKYVYKNQHNKDGGYFLIPHPNIAFMKFFCVASSGMGWEHVSISICKTVGTRLQQEHRSPTWMEMSIIKDIFWDPEDAVMQLHPPRSQYVSQHPYCLHLWRPTNQTIPLPDPILVGIPGSNKQSF